MSANLSARAIAALAQILGLETRVDEIGEESAMAQCHEIIDALSVEERQEIAGKVRDCALRAQRCAVGVLKRQKLLALALAVGGAKLNNGDAVALYQKHVDRDDFPLWLRAVIQVKLDAAQVAIDLARKNAEVVMKKLPKPVQSQPRQAKNDVVVVSVAPATPVAVVPQQKSRREKLEELLEDMRRGSWVVHDVAEVLAGMSDCKRARADGVVAQIEAEKGPCFLKVRESVAGALKKAGFHDAGKAIMEDGDCEEAEQSLVAVLKARPTNVPAWMRGPINYRLYQIRELAEKRRLTEADEIVGQWIDLIDVVQRALVDVKQIPDLAESLLGEVEQLFDEAVDIRCEFWALEQLIEAGDAKTIVGRKLLDDPDFASKVHAKGSKKKAAEFRVLLLDTAYDAVEELRQFVRSLPKVNLTKKKPGRRNLWSSENSNSRLCYEVVSGETGRRV